MRALVSGLSVRQRAIESFLGYPRTTFSAVRVTTLPFSRKLPTLGWSFTRRSTTVSQFRGTEEVAPELNLFVGGLDGLSSLGETLTGSDWASLVRPLGEADLVDPVAGLLTTEGGGALGSNGIFWGWDVAIRLGNGSFLGAVAV